MTDKKIVQVGTGVLIIRDGHILLGKRKGSHGEGTWSLPGGHVDFGEEPEDAARREVLEETGMIVRTIWKYPNYPWVNTHFADSKQYITLFFQAECDGDPRVLERDKCSAWAWYDLCRLPSPLFGDLEKVL